MIDITKCKSFVGVKSRFFLNLPKNYKKNEMKDMCWEWKGSKYIDGYGRLGWGTTRYSAHHISYMIFKGPILSNQVVRHTCNNKSCVNPTHLIIGSQSDNLIDSLKQNRHSTQKLNEEAVKVIKWMLKYKNEKGLAAKLALLYKVNPDVISKIKKGKSWSWVNI